MSQEAKLGKWIVCLVLTFAVGGVAITTEAKRRHHDGQTANMVKKDKGRKSAPAVKPPPTLKREEVCKRDPAIPAGQIDILFKICEGKKLLSGLQAQMKVCETKAKVCQKVGKGKKAKKICKTVVTGHPICHRTIILAALELATGKLKAVEVDDSPSDKAGGFLVRRRSHGGVNSEYDVKSPPGWVVVGIQYPLTVRTAKGFERVRAIYTPYSKELREKFPELTVSGVNYLKRILAEARSRLAKSGVDVLHISNTVLITLIFIEHFSGEEVNDGTPIMEDGWRVQLTLGANGPEAYKYSVSSARARGLAQIIPDTWKRLHNRYPKLLPADFFRGTADHTTAVVGQLLLAKEDINFLFSQRGWRGDAERQKDFLGDEKKLGQFLAVSYNGGGPRAYRWENGNRAGVLPRETRLYLVKFNQVWDNAFQR